MKIVSHDNYLVSISVLSSETFVNVLLLNGNVSPIGTYGGNTISMNIDYLKDYGKWTPNQFSKTFSLAFESFVFWKILTH